MAVVLEHLLRDVTGNIHDRLIARATLCQLRDERVPVIVKASGHLGIFADIGPSRLQGGDAASWVAGAGLPEGKDIPLRLNLAKSVCVPCDVLCQCWEQRGVQGNGATFATLRFAATDG